MGFLVTKIFSGTCVEGRNNELEMEGWWMEREQVGTNVQRNNLLFYYEENNKKMKILEKLIWEKLY